jgi:hypothetical protein
MFLTCGETGIQNKRKDTATARQQSQQGALDTPQNAHNWHPNKQPLRLLDISIPEEILEKLGRSVSQWVLQVIVLLVTVLHYMFRPTWPSSSV